ncbi:MAG TPA: hypothetical protein VM325_19290 [Alphaproteobacteria bacterium]|nr:hypothetical protein [Alphaproteobacteria bacterium]
MNDLGSIRRIAPARLSTARDLAHKAVQLVTKAARANLTAAPDDSHSNLGWERKRGAFLSQPIMGKTGTTVIGFAVSGFELIVIHDGQEIAARKLAGIADTDAAEWLDTQLANTGLAPTASTTLPYDLPASVERIDAYALDGVAEDLEVLASWFMLADIVLAASVEKNAHLDPGPSPVRCWPHHFDIATYIRLEDGDFETARGIGVGMSPGDGTYGEPYFYINPWPHLSADTLPELPAPGHWHTKGFVGAIATASEILSLPDIDKELRLFTDGAVAIGRTMLGA